VQTGNTPHNLEEPTLEELMREMTEINIKFQEWAANKIAIQKEEPTLEELVRQMEKMNMKYDQEWEAKKIVMQKEPDVPTSTDGGEIIC